VKLTLSDGPSQRGVFEVRILRFQLGALVLPLDFMTFMSFMSFSEPDTIAHPAPILDLDLVRG